MFALAVLEEGGTAASPLLSECAVDDSQTGSSINANVKTHHQHHQQQFQHEHQQQHGKLGSFALAIMGYALVCGGPFGIEPVVGGLGPLYALLGCGILALLWAVPQAAITAELGCALPEGGGQVGWVHAAMGARCGIANSWIMACWQLIDLPSATLMMASYIQQRFPALSDGGLYGVKFAALALALVCNLCGIDVVKWAAGLLAAFVYIPVLILPFGATFSGASADWSVFRPGNHPAAWDGDTAVAVATLMWCYSGYWALGTLAPHMRAPVNRHFPRGAVGAVALCTLNFAFPIVFGAPLAPHMDDWQAGFFVNLADRLAGWAGDWMMVAAVAANFVCFNSCLGAYSHGIHASARRGDFYWLGRWLAPTQSTTRTLLFVAVVCALLMSGFGFDTLIVIDSSVSMLMSLFLIGAFACLRLFLPELHRPYALGPTPLLAWLSVASMTACIAFSFYVLFYQALWGPLCAFGLLFVSFALPAALPRPAPMLDPVAPAQQLRGLWGTTSGAI